jgi:beta-N-acetylglucosaminidase
MELYNPGHPFHRSSPWNPARAHPVTGVIRSHRGEDWGAPSGTPIPAAGAGKVVYKGVMSGYGNVVVLEHANGSEIVHTLYAHMSAPSPLAINSAVAKGESVGPCGNTGIGTGPHLHFEVLQNGAAGAPNLAKGHATVDPHTFDISNLTHPDSNSPTRQASATPQTAAKNGFFYQFPIRKPDGSHYQLEELYKELEKESSGHYLLGNHGFWHGGIHISEKSAPQCKYKEPVRCIADGEVVAYRLNNSYLASTFQGDSECTSLQYSTSFCLVRHQYESPKRAPETSAKPKINWVGRNVQLATSRNARDVAEKTLGKTGNFECLMPAGTELQILKVQDEQVDGYHFANAKLIKGVLNGKDKTGSPVSLTVGSDIWFAALDKHGEIINTSDKSAIFTDSTPAPAADAKPASTRPETNKLSFFSLYMHLLPYEQYPSKENQANRRLTIKASDLNVRQEANLTGEPLGHITSGAEVEVLTSSADYRKQPADTTTYELAQVKILSKEVKKAGQQTAKVGDIVWLALSKSEAGKPVLRYAKELVKDTLARPAYWKGQVKARLTKRIPAFKNATDDDSQRIGLVAENSVLEYHTSSLKRVTRNGQPQLMAECSIISGGLWDKPFCPATLWVVIDTATAELTPDAPSDFDSVVIGAIPIKAGDTIGYLGLYETPRSAKGGKNSLHQVHVEVFTNDAQLESFLKNPAGISAGRKYVRVSQGKPQYNKTGTEQQPIFTASGQLLSENYCAGQEQVKLLKGSDGKEWYCLKLNTGSSTADAYIAKPDAEIISQHDWEKLGFQIIKENNGNADGFLDPEATPDFYQSLYQQIDQVGNQDGKVTPDEISRALKDHKLRDRWSKLIGYHPTEWQAKSDEPKWQKMNELLKDSPEVLRHEKERIDNLVFWDEMSRSMQVGLPKQIYHFHPLEFIDALTITKPITKNLTKEDFVKLVHNSALLEEARSGVPAAITTAQAILETGYGRSVPTDVNTAKYSYNLFGIKAHGHPDFVEIWTHEEVNCTRIKILDKFRSYSSFEDSIKGRTEFFINNKRYQDLLSSQDASFWADELQKKGYATDSQYANKLKSIIKSWKL